MSAKTLRLLVAVLLVGAVAVPTMAQDTGLRRSPRLSIDVWVNKGEDARYYYGEDVAIYFRASDDCYVVVYDIDPAGNVGLLFPPEYNQSTFVKGGEVYRIPDYDADYRLEATGPSGYEYVYALASYDPIPFPDFIRGQFYDYGDWDYYADNFIHRQRGDRQEFVARLNERIVGGPYVMATTSFYVDSRYRHHRWWRYWTCDPYYWGSIWVGVDWPGCEVWIDGIYYGIAPVLVPRIYVGRHYIWIFYRGFPCWHDYVYVSRGRRYHADIKIRHRDGGLGWWAGPFGDSKTHRWELKQIRHPNDPDFEREIAKHPSVSPKHPRSAPEWVKQKYASERIDPTVKVPRYPENGVALPSPTRTEPSPGKRWDDESGRESSQRSLKRGIEVLPPSVETPSGDGGLNQPPPKRSQVRQEKRPVDDGGIIEVRKTVKESPETRSPVLAPAPGHEGGKTLRNSDEPSRPSAPAADRDKNKGTEKSADKPTRDDGAREKRGRR